METLRLTILRQGRVWLCYKWSVLPVLCWFARETGGGKCHLDSLGERQETQETSQNRTSQFSGYGCPEYYT